MKSNVKKYFITFLVIIVLLGGFAAFRLKQLKKGIEVQQNAGFPVETIIAQRGIISQELTYVGNIEPWQEIDLAPRISARIISINGREGDMVKAGQLAITLDNGDLQGKISTLSKRVQTAKLNVDYWNDQMVRNQTLINEGAIAEQDFQKILFNRDTAQSGYEEAQAALQEARIGLDNSLIQSPMTGTVINVNSYPGDLAVPGKPIITLGDISHLKVSLKVIEDDLIKLKTGTLASLSPGDSKKRYSAKITKIYPVLDKTARTGNVELSLPQDLIKSYGLKPGMSINVYFILGEKQNILVVPQKAVTIDGNTTFLYTVKEGKAVRRVITTGISDDKFIEVTGGLAAGDRIVTSGLAELYDGRPLYLAREKG